jgi:hypothetical protein
MGFNSKLTRSYMGVNFDLIGIITNELKFN